MRLLPTLFVIAICALFFMTSCSPAPDTEPKADTEQQTQAASPAESDEAATTTESSEQSATQEETAEDTPQRVTIGEKARDFRLKDQHGEEQALSDLVKESKVALVFFRSAGW